MAVLSRDSQLLFPSFVLMCGAEISRLFLYESLAPPALQSVCYNWLAISISWEHGCILLTCFLQNHLARLNMLTNPVCPSFFLPSFVDGI